MSSLSKQCVKKAEEGGYAALMNDTKWRELCFALATLSDRKPSWRARDFLNGQLSPWDREWFHHVGPDYCSIEWLEIDPSDCSLSEIRNVLDTVGVAFEESEYLRVYGYKKSNRAAL